MASGAGKSAAFMLLVLNVFLYFIVTVISGWAINHAILRSHEAGTLFSLNMIYIKKKKKGFDELNVTKNICSIVSVNPS